MYIHYILIPVIFQEDWKKKTEISMRLSMIEDTYPCQEKGGDFFLSKFLPAGN